MYQQDRELLKQRWLSFWNLENHDRPLISVTAPRDGATYDKTPLAAVRERWFDTEQVVARARRTHKHFPILGRTFWERYADVIWSSGKTQAGPSIMPKTGNVCPL